jgi:hypothetical protein
MQEDLTLFEWITIEMILVPEIICLISLGFHFLGFCRMGISRSFISEIKKRMEYIVALAFVDPSKLGIVLVGREILRRIVGLP